jgi:hypothetical protein
MRFGVWLSLTPLPHGSFFLPVWQGAEKVGTDVILRSEATKNLLSIPVSQSENSRSFAPLRMTR